MSSKVVKVTTKSSDLKAMNFAKDMTDNACLSFGTMCETLNEFCLKEDVSATFLLIEDDDIETNVSCPYED